MLAISMKDDPKMISTIKAAIEEEFKKSYGKPFDWKSLLKNYNIRKFAEENKLIIASNSPDLPILRAYIQECLKTSDIYSFVSEDLEKTNYKIKRVNRYEGVQDYKTLVSLIESHPEGVYVDEDLTSFTYKEANSDILRAISEKKIKKIYTSNLKDDQHFYVFPRTLETEYEIRQDYFKHFKYTQYLELCSHINGLEDDEDNGKMSKSCIAKESAGDPNYKLAGYLQQKEKWLKRNVKK